MAEAHPVGFRWAMKARERGATIIHVDPRFSRTSAMADMHVPIRAGSRHRLPRRADPPRARHRAPTSRSTSSTTRTRRRSSTRTSRAPRTSAASSPAGTRRPRPTTRTRGATRAASVASPAGHARARDPGVQRAPGRRDDARATPKRDETLEHPRTRLPPAHAPLRALHARDGRASLRHLAGGLPARRRTLIAQLGPRADDRVLLRGRLDAAHRRRADDPRRRDPAAAARQHRPPRRRHHGDARARVDPGLDRHPDALRPAAGLPADAARAREGEYDLADLRRPATAPSAAGGRTSTSTSSRC